MKKRKDKSVNKVSSIYDKLFDCTVHLNRDTLNCLITHNIYKDAEGNPFKWTDLEKFAKWMDNRLEARRNYLVEVLTPHKYWVTQKKGMERAFTGDYWWVNDVGMYNCSICT